jgi:hypothetical protein
MLLKRYRLGAFIRVIVDKNWRYLKTNFRRYKDPLDDDVNYCTQYCIFWNTAEGYCKYNAEIDCENFDTPNYSYIPCS